MNKKHLNKEQLMAIKHKKGPLMIIAGAGTGKTTVITERVKHIVSAGWASPSEVLALTFTEKAALEMETRIDEALPLGYTQMWVTTFHEFCSRVLKESAIHIGLDPKYKLLTGAESLHLLRTHLFDLDLNYFRPLGSPDKFLFGLLQHFSRLQDENIKPSEYLVWAKNFEKKSSTDDKLEALKWMELATAYQKYSELKISSSLMDFGDLITNTIKLFKERPNILKEYKEKFKYILVDEFQDTNFSQNELVKFLSGENGNTTVVLDDDQSVYRFRGAAISNALSFKKSFKKAKIVSLVQNYRSFQGILDHAHLFINHNNPDRLEVIEKIDKRLISNRKGVSDVGFTFHQTAADEANFVVEKILFLKKSQNRSFGDFAILVRANNHADSFLRAFSENDIPYQFLGPGKLFEEEEIIELICYLKVLNDIDDSQSLYKVLSIPDFQIDSLDIARLTSFSRKQSKSLLEVCLNLEGIEIKEATKEKVKQITNKIISDLKDISKKGAGAILYSFLEEVGLLKKFLNAETEHDILTAENITKFFGKIKAYELSQKQINLSNFINWINLQIELGESPLSAEVDWENSDSVKILTVHSSKGLEFPVVFLVNLVGQRFPSMDRREQIPIPDTLIKETLPTGDFHLQEERRLFYVGMTRAKDNLYLTAAKFYGDAKREKKISPFVLESGLLEGDKGKKNKDSGIVFINQKEQTSKVLNNTKVSYLSYSQIETFKLCELHYKLRYILNIPTSPTAAQSFGNSFHKVLKEFYIEVGKGNTAAEKLLNKLLNENWIREGYRNKKHNEESFKKAQEYLLYFLNNYYDSKSKNLGVEIPFNFKISDLRVGGIIDRVDSEKGVIHIVDYKTGDNVMTQKEADNSLQLSIYALAATNINEPPFQKVKPEDIKLSLNYFSDPKIVTTYRTQKQLKEAKEEILNWREKIEKSDYRCTNSFFCSDCEYKMFCGSEIKD